MTRFDRDTKLSEHDRGRFRVRIDRGWFVTHGPNGGYIAALMLRGIQHAVGNGELIARTLTIHYLLPLVEGEAWLDVEIERKGRTLMAVSARLEQGGRRCALALAALSKSRPQVDCEFEESSMLDVPVPEGLERYIRLGVPLHDRLETRFLPGFDSARAQKDAVVAGWLRLAEPRELDAPQLALYADAMIPSISGLIDAERSLGAPTVELTIHFYLDRVTQAIADDDFVLSRSSTHTARESFVTEDTDIWSRQGTLLCHARQLAALVER